MGGGDAGARSGGAGRKGIVQLPPRPLQARNPPPGIPGAADGQGRVPGKQGMPGGVAHLRAAWAWPAPGKCSPDGAGDWTPPSLEGGVWRAYLVGNAPQKVTHSRLPEVARTRGVTTSAKLAGECGAGRKCGAVDTGLAGKCSPSGRPGAVATRPADRVADRAWTRHGWAGELGRPYRGRGPGRQRTVQGSPERGL